MATTRRGRLASKLWFHALDRAAFERSSTVWLPTILTHVRVPEPADRAYHLLAAGGCLPRHEAKPRRAFHPTTAHAGIRHGGGYSGGDHPLVAWYGDDP